MQPPPQLAPQLRELLDSGLPAAINEVEDRTAFELERVATYVEANYIQVC